MDHSIQAFLPQLRRNLLRLGVEDPLLELFKGVHRYNWARNQLLMAEVLPVVAALERDGIPTILLKGAALVANERHDAGARQMSDIDVLVPTDSLGAACAVLQDSGMAPAEDIPLWYVTDYAPQFKHSCNFRNRAEGQLDLHWHALKWSCHRDADAEFWAAAQPVRLGEVSSRALCPADELLIVILHGLRWSPTPSYRWILDAALLVRSEPEAIDYDRVLAQARRHRVTHATRSGLLMLRRVAELDVPDEALRALAQAAPLQRLELTAQATQPRWRRRVGRAASLHLQYLRRELAPGLPVSPRDHLRLAAERLGYERPRRVADVRVHGAPGPGRPFAEHGAPLGVGECTPPALPWGTAIDFGDPELVRAHCRYGMWLPADGSSWIAGREAALRIALPEMPSYPLVLELAAGGVSPATHRQRLEVRVGGELVGGVELGPRRPERRGGAVRPAGAARAGTPPPRDRALHGGPDRAGSPWYQRRRAAARGAHPQPDASAACGSVRSPRASSSVSEAGSSRSWPEAGPNRSRADAGRRDRRRESSSAPRSRRRSSNGRRRRWHRCAWRSRRTAPDSGRSTTTSQLRRPACRSPPRPGPRTCCSRGEFASRFRPGNSDARMMTGCSGCSSTACGSSRGLVDTGTQITRQAERTEGVFVVARRWDQLGARLSAIANARSLARMLDIEFRFVWPRGHDRAVNQPLELFAPGVPRRVRARAPRGGRVHRAAVPPTPRARRRRPPTQP